MSFLAFLEQEVPSDAYDFAILREKVVPSTSNITVNLDVALRTHFDRG